MMLADRTCAVVRAIEALIAYHVLAGVEHMRGSHASAKQAGLIGGLKKVNEYLRPPELQRVRWHAIREAPKQRLVLLVPAEVSEQDAERPDPESDQLVQGCKFQPRPESQRQDVADFSEFQLHGAKLFLG
jgi:hypothetical protein